jgi:arsenate reductase
MESPDALAVLTAIASRWRLETFRLLVRYLPYGLAAGDIARLLALTHNSLSMHLAILERAGLVRSRREGRSIIFVAVTERMRRLAAFLSEDQWATPGGTHGEFAFSDRDPFPTKREPSDLNIVNNVLVVCTGNSARSIMAEAILNKEGQGRFRAFSAGSHPKAQLDSDCLILLENLGYDVRTLRPKSWNEFTGHDAPTMHFVLTVCDLAAREKSPRWPGEPITAHWGIADPAAIVGTDARKRAAFVEAYRRLAVRISSLVNLDVRTCDPATLRRNLYGIGAMDGATEMALQLNAA